VYINNHYLGFWPYGYTAFSYNLTPYLNFGEETNEILVRVDRTNFLDARWYSGSGIYRDVKLVTKAKTHIPKWGVKIETPTISSENAKVTVNLQTVNASLKQTSLKVVHSILDQNSNQVFEKEVQFQQKDSLQTQQINLEVDQPEFWSPKSPNLYKLVSKLYNDNQLVDEVENTFGIRSFRFDAKKGFFLNDKTTFIKGVCLHHDGGAVGAAVPKELWIRRLKKLKEGGINAIRTAHNPASKEFLNLCDSLGFLVQEEIFDELDYPKDKRKNYNKSKDDEYTEGYTNHFQKYWKRDLASMIQRDKNHPSIFMWSIGNEVEWTYPRYEKASGYWESEKSYYYDEPPYSIDEMKSRFAKIPPQKYELAKTVNKLSAYAKSIDTTRPITANLVIPSISHFSGYTDALDVVGYSYRNCLYNYGHKNYPDKMIYGSENWANYIEWKSVLDNPHIPGIFLWTGIYYMGETRELEARGSTSGLIAYSGQPTPRWYQFKSVWTETPTLYATTYPLKNSYYKLKNNKVVYKEKEFWKYKEWSWQPYNTHWNYSKNEIIVVEVFSNCPEVKLLLNGEEKGIEKLADNKDKVFKFALPYESGELKVVGNCSEEISYTIKTAGTPSNIKLVSDKKEAKKGEFVSIEAQLVDEYNNPVNYNDSLITFQLDDTLEFIAIENDSNIIKTTSSKPRIETYRGKAFLYLKAKDKIGTQKITAILPNGTTTNLSITIK